MKESPLVQMLRSGTNVVVDAGAGSGKTTTIVNAVTSLFLSDLSLTPEEVLLLTFTEKAAAEMRERLFSLWQSLFAQLRAPGARAITDILGGFPGVISLSPDLAGSRDLLLHRVMTLREHQGGLNVSTLHSFCMTLLREYPVEAGCDPGFEVVDTFEVSTAFDDAFREFLDEEFGKESFDPRWEEYFDLFPDLNSGREFLWDFLGSVCVHHRDLFFIARETRARGRDANLTPYFDTYLVPLYGLLRRFLLSSAPREEDIIEAFSRLGPLNDHIMALASRGAIPERSTLEQFTELLSSIDGTRLRKKELFPLNREEFTLLTHRGGELTADTFKATLPKIRERLKECTSILHRLCAGSLLGDLLIEKSDRMLTLFEHHKGSGMDFMDLLLNAALLIKDSREIRESLKRRYRYLFVDEFQDTDPIQAYLCSFICEKDGAFADDPADVDLKKGKLFIVGDPRQSIYRFRRADPQMHFQMSEKILSSGGTRHSLVKNYRSTPALVSFFNLFFGSLFVKDSDYAFTYGPPQIPDRSDDGPSSRICYYSLEQEVGRERFLASLLVAMKRTGLPVEEGGSLRPLSWKDVAILYVGDFGKRVLSPLRDQLVEAGIPVILPSLKGFYDRQEVKDILFLLEAICDPEHTTALYGALKSPIFGFTDTDLAGYFTKGDIGSAGLGEALSLIKRWASLRDTTGVYDLIASLLEESGYWYSALLMPQGQRVYFNLEKLLLLAREFDRKYASSLRVFTGFLRQQIKVAAEEGEIPYFEEGEDAVRIMTVHSAKGLEFPVVVYYLTGEFSSRDPGPILYDRIRGTFGLSHKTFTTPSCYTMVTDTVESGKAITREQIPFVALEARKAAAERLRLSYVAMSRARDHLFVVSQPPGRGQMKKNILAEQLEAFLSPFPATERPCPLTGRAGKTHEIEGGVGIFSASVSKDPHGREDTRESRKWSPVLPGVRQEKEEIPPPLATIEGSGTAREERGFSFGSTIHRILETHPPFEGTLFAHRQRIALAHFSEGRDRERFLLLVAQMEKGEVLKQFRTWEILATEVPLTALEDGAVARDSADVLLTDGKRIVVIDYKTGSRNSVNDTRYAAQLARYIRAIEDGAGMTAEGIVWYVEENEWFLVSGRNG